MAETKSTLAKMFISLTLICILSAAILASVNNITQEPIAKAKSIRLEQAVQNVIPGFTNSPIEEMYEVSAGEKGNFKIYPAKNNDELIGVAVESYTMNGFNGEIKILVGMKPDGTITNYEVLQHGETPGLGDKMATWFKTEKNNQSIIGKVLSQGSLKLTKNGGDIDAITASTITSRAFLEAVNEAYSIYSGSTDAGSGATEKTDGESGATGIDGNESKEKDVDAESGATEEAGDATETTTSN